MTGPLEGVPGVSVDFDARWAVVRYDDAVTTVEDIAEASANAGYPASEIE